jgi:TatD DNase family protein
VIDTHAHLDALDEDPAAVVARARDVGVSRILTIGTGQAVALADAHDGVYAVVGVHPHDAGDPYDLDLVRGLLAHPKAVAVGEIGLDYFRDYAPHDAQEELFDAQLEIARELGKPVVVHTRAADTDTLAQLERFDGTVVLHCFSSPQLLPTALDRGWYISFAGNVTYKNASDLRVAATQVPVDRLLAETDCPYLAPQPVRGRKNEPAFVVHTLAQLAEIRGEAAAELRDQIDRNASACFAL